MDVNFSSVLYSRQGTWIKHWANTPRQSQTWWVNYRQKYEESLIPDHLTYFFIKEHEAWRSYQPNRYRNWQAGWGAQAKVIWVTAPPPLPLETAVVWCVQRWRSIRQQTKVPKLNLESKVLKTPIANQTPDRLKKYDIRAQNKIWEFKDPKLQPSLHITTRQVLPNWA